ncbi:GNAT family N-acetyltransferase [Candidatus Aerophobetes bacterium]|nr:GNAT family N-acetyltransferase [Candidatus Aerophobetes bacterium]
MSDVEVRKYRAQDRQSIRDICCDTGFFGRPIELVFRDRELFADLFTRYYTDEEPESAFVAECKGEVIGYLLGCKDSKKFRKYLISKVILPRLPELIWRYFTWYDKRDREYVRWLLFRSWKEMPKTPENAAHFHFDLKKEYRGKGIGKRLLNRFIIYLKENKVKRVYGGVLSFERKRTEKLYRRVGFKIYDKKKVSMWKDEGGGKIFWLRVVKEIGEENEP